MLRFNFVQHAIKQHNNEQLHLPRAFQVHVTILDENDNRPVFTQHTYEATIAENVALNPPAAILKVKFPLDHSAIFTL